ncbi:MAG: hypothetical protein JSV33_11165 [bacterium]|nr:MAG: hypothetical protein JSV33_11165 [bacterium]
MRKDTCLVTALVVAVLYCAGGMASSREVRITSTGVRSVTFEVEVPQPGIVPAGEGHVRLYLPGYGSFSPPGAVEVPGRSFYIAVPPRGDVRVTFTVLETEKLGDLRLVRVPGERFIEGENGIPVTEVFHPSDPWAESGPPPVIESGDPSFMGRQRVLPVRVNPIRIDSGGLTLVRRLSIRVEFDGYDRGAVEMEDLLRPPSGSGAWDRLYSDLLVNPEDVSRFRRQLRPRRSMRKPYEAGKKLKIAIHETGLYSLRADSLIDAGLLSPNLPTGFFAMKKYYYDETEPDLLREVDIPLLVIEGSSPNTGFFDGDDRMIFYVLGIKDDTEAGDTDASFTDNNTVWLEEEVPGALWVERPPLPAESGMIPVESQYTVHGRTDTYYHKRARPGASDFNYVTGYVELEIALPFTVHDPVPSRTFSVTVRVTGTRYDINEEHLEISVRNSGTGEHLLGVETINSKSDFTFNYEAVTSDWLTDGENELVIRTDVTYGFLVNDFSVTYPRSFVSYDDMLEFSIQESPIINTATVTIPGFSINEGYLLDITDLGSPRYIKLPSEFYTQDGETYTCTFNIESDADGHFILLGDNMGEYIPTGMVSIDSPSHIREETGPYDALIVSHADFVDSMRVYAEWRRSNGGYRILTVDVADVYDEFNGGLPSCQAIKRFLRYGVDQWGVEFVLLVGDSNEDRKRIVAASGPDFVPTYTYSVGVISQSYDDEVVASDRWYSFLDEDGSDSFPDVFLGRFPVGSDSELRAIRSKLIHFEQSSQDETWRRRVILFSDDSWSGRGSDYRYRYYENEFESSMGRIADWIDDALPGGFDIQRLFLSHWTDGAHENNSESGPAVYSRANDTTRTYFTPYLIRRLNEGSLLFTFQGHANRSTLTTEAGFATFAQYDDLDSLAINNRLNIFIGVGCHISEFAPLNELQRTYDGPNGDCFSEQILFKPGKGSVASYASTGYEYLSENARFCERMHRVIFQDPPSDSVPPLKEYTGSHWILGEAITKAEIEHIGSTSYGYRQVLRYLLLGDPMTRLDPGPPLMTLEANWGDGWVSVAADSFRAMNGTNDCTIRFLASDVIALGAIRCFVDGDDRTDTLEITPLTDEDKTYARSYRADLDYTVNLEDGMIVFRVDSPEGVEVGYLEIPFETSVSLFYKDNIEITPGVESPPTGRFRLEVDFPAYLSQEPVLLLNDVEMTGVSFTVPDPEDSLHWEAAFRYTFSAGDQKLTVKVGDFLKDFFFTVTGDQLEMESFAFPNPFSEGTNIVYTLNLPVEAGSIDIYNVSGTHIRRFELESRELDAALYPLPNSVYWDGRDSAGDRIANGTYIYFLQVVLGGTELTMTGKCVKLE